MHDSGIYKEKARCLSELLAVWTGLEPATPCVTGRYSNQLNYHTVCGSFAIFPVPGRFRSLNVSSSTTNAKVIR